MNPRTFGQAFDALSSSLGKPAGTRSDDDGVWHATWQGHRFEVLLWQESLEGGAIIEAWTGNGDAAEMTASQRWAVSPTRDAPALASAWIAEQGVTIPTEGASR